MERVVLSDEEKEGLVQIMVPRDQILHRLVAGGGRVSVAEVRRIWRGVDNDDETMHSTVSRIRGRLRRMRLRLERDKIQGEEYYQVTRVEAEPEPDRQ